MPGPVDVVPGRDVEEDEQKAMLAGTCFVLIQDGDVSLLLLTIGRSLFGIMIQAVPVARKTNLFIVEFP